MRRNITIKILTNRSLLNRKEYLHLDLSIRSTNKSYYEYDQFDLNFRSLSTKRLSKGLNTKENDYPRKLPNNLTTKAYNLNMKTYFQEIINNQVQLNKFKSCQEIIIDDQTQLNRSNKRHYDDKGNQKDVQRNQIHHLSSETISTMGSTGEHI